MEWIQIYHENSERSAHSNDKKQPFQDGNHDAKYFLLYYYYGGMIYTAVKNYERALYFFEVAITTPAVAMSHIMLESYKKYILVSLILHGTVNIEIRDHTLPRWEVFLFFLFSNYHTFP